MLLVVGLAACAGAGVSDLGSSLTDNPSLTDSRAAADPQRPRQPGPPTAALDDRTGGFAWLPGDWAAEIIVPPKPIPATRPLRPPAPRVARRARPPRAGTTLVALQAAPFPFDGTPPGRTEPFLNVSADGRSGHRTGSGRVYWADETYADRRSLLHIPKGFDLAQPAVLVVFFHGHGATLERDVWKRQQVPRQIDASGMNAVLVAPQFAVDARDSSIGRFWQAGAIRRYLDESAAALARLYGDAAAAGQFAELPIVLVGYSGGFAPAAWALTQAGVADRVAGVVLLDGVYGHVGTFAEWIGHSPASFLVSGYTRFTEKGNEQLRAEVAKLGVTPLAGLPQRLGNGAVSLIRADGSHRDYVTAAWAPDPLADVLRRIDGLPRRGQPAQVAARRR